MCLTSSSVCLSLVDKGVELGQVPTEIEQHHSKTLCYFVFCFPRSFSELMKKQWVRDPFTNPETSNLPSVVQDNLQELSCDAGLQSRFTQHSLSEFWLCLL